jgi:DNA repair protein RadC
VDVSSLSDQALIDQLLQLGPAEPITTEYRFREAAAPWVRPRYPQRLQCILDLSKELLMRDLLRTSLERPLLDSPGTFNAWLRLRFMHVEHEEFLVVFLDSHHHLIDIETMFRGTLDQASVYPREVVKAVLRHNAAAAAFVHCHPSGDPTPSRADETLTKTLKEALAVIDVCCIDHWIVAGDHVVSMAGRGMM